MKKRHTNKRHVVVCDGCAHLLVVEHMTPCCLLKAAFVDTPLYKHTDVRGMVPAQTRNKNLSCPSKQLFSLRSLRMRLWFRRDCRKKGIGYRGRSLRSYKDTE